jgi:integrase
VPLGAAGRCRLCLAASHATSTLLTGQGGVQLFMLVGTPAAVRSSPPERSRPAPSAGLGQLRLSKAAARTAARSSPGQRPRLRPADRLRRGEHRELLAAVVGYGQARGWSPSTLRRVQHSLAALLASQPTPAWPLEAAVVRQFLHERHLTALRVVEFLADQGLVHVDEHAALDRWLAYRLAPLPAPIRAEVQAWIQGLRGRGPRAGRPRQAATIQGYLRALHAPLTDWAARYQSLRQVTGDDITDQLAAVTGATRLLTLAAMRSMFGTLKTRRVIFANPTSGQVGRKPAPAPALGLAPAVRAGLLARLDSPHERLIVLLAGVHALRTSEIRALTLDDVDLATGKLLVDGQPRPLDALTRAEFVAWLERRRDRWPTSANPHLLVNTYTVGGIKPVSRSFVHHACRRLGLSAHQLRVDRLLAEVHATAGDPLKLTKLFGLSDPTAIRYCAELEQTTVPRSPDGRPT